MGRWYVNGVNLSRFAFNVKNRSAGWRMAAKRGENLVVPGRSGNVFLRNKPSDVGNISLSMWVLGADLDGGIPQDFNRQLAIENHMDSLTRLFGSGQLVEVARTLDDSVDYKRRNLIPNPSFEAKQGKTVVRENTVVNGSVEYWDGLETMRTNLLLNPSFENTAGKMTYRRNLLPNPRMATDGPEKRVRTNLVANPSFEANTKTWAPNRNCDLDRIREDLGGRGPWVGRVRCNTADTAIAMNGGSTAVTAGTLYGIQAKVGNGVLSAGPFLVQVFVRWRRKNGEEIQVDQVGVGQELTRGSSALISGVLTAPAGAREAIIRVKTAGGRPVGDVLLVDEVMVEELPESATQVGKYFDGTYPDHDGLRRRWDDDAGQSTSEEYRTMPRGYYAPASTVLVGLSERETRRGFQAAKCWAWVPAAQGAPVFRTNPTQSAKCLPKKVVSGGVFARLHDSYGEDEVRTFTLTLRCYDEDGDYLGDCTGDAPSDTVEVSNGRWSRLQVDNVTTVKKTVYVGLDVASNQPLEVGESVYFDCSAIERGTFLGTWFDGASGDSATFAYDWAGERHWSPSVQSGRWVEWWAVDSGAGFQAAVDDARRGDMVYRMLPRPWMGPNDRIRAKSFSDDVVPGRLHTFSVYVRPSTGMGDTTMRVDLQWSSIRQGKTLVQGADTSCPAGEWTRLTITAVCPDRTEAVFPTIRHTQAATAATEIDVDCALFEVSGFLRPWFSGGSVDNYLNVNEYEWSGKRHASTSLWRRKKATGWHPYGTAYPVIYRQGAAGDDDGPGSTTHGDCYARVMPMEPGNAGITCGRSEIDTDDPRTFAVDVWADEACSVDVGIVWKNAKNKVISKPETRVSVAAQTWTRLTITEEPPDNAAFGAGYAVRIGVTGKDVVTLFDAALFGFGGASAYHDGDDGSGWQWTGKRGLSSSVEYGDKVLYWTCWDGTLERVSSWSKNRNYSGKFVTIDDDAPRISPHVPLKWDDRQFMVDEGETVTFACWVKARDACRVEARLIGLTYDGLKFVDWDVGPRSDPYDLKAGQEKRVMVQGVPAPVGSGYTHFRAQIRVFANGGGKPPLQTGIFLDAAVASYGDSAKYIDGQQKWVRWTNGKDQSQSEVYGPARRAMAEVVAGVDAESMAGGTRAEFDVEMQVPDVYWEDTWTTVEEYPFPREKSVISLVGLKGGTAPIDDALIELHGPFRDLRIRDIGSGAWIEVEGKWAEDQALYVDSGAWTVVDRRGRSRIGQIKHGGHPRLLPLTYEPKKPWPRLDISADAFGADAFIRVHARRRFFVA